MGLCDHHEPEAFIWRTLLNLFQGWMNYNTYASNGYFLDLEPYKEYMPDILDLIGNYVEMGYTGDKLYSVTSVL